MKMHFSLILNFLAVLILRTNILVLIERCSRSCVSTRIKSSHTRNSIAVEWHKISHGDVQAVTRSQSSCLIDYTALLESFIGFSSYFLCFKCALQVKTSNSCFSSFLLPVLIDWLSEKF